MGIFGSKRSSSQGAKAAPVPSSTEDTLNIQTIPEVFYGGNNPLIYESSGATPFSSAPVTIQPKKTFEQPKRSRTATSEGHTHIIMWIIIVSVLLALAASAYYVFKYLNARRNITQTNQPISQNTDDQNNTFVTSSTVETATSTSSTLGTSENVSSTPSLVSQFLEFPPLNTANTVDLDADEITDIEEQLFDIDSGTWDTDQDGYYDGQEITNLYNPRGFAPVKLVDSGLVKEYSNSLSEYRIYYPITWQRGSVDTLDRHVLFSSITGEYIEVRVFTKDPGTTFGEWFGKNAEGQQFSDLTSFVNRFLVPGWLRRDGLVVYYENQRSVFVIIYHQADGRAPVPYRSTLKMMYQSFRPGEVAVELPEQTILVTTTTPVNSSPNAQP